MDKTEDYKVIKVNSMSAEDISGTLEKLIGAHLDKKLSKKTYNYLYSYAKKECENVEYEFKSLSKTAKNKTIAYEKKLQISTHKAIPFKLSKIVKRLGLILSPVFILVAMVFTSAISYKSNLSAIKNFTNINLYISFVFFYYLYSYLPMFLYIWFLV